MIPGELILEEGELELNGGRATIGLAVANTGDRPIQVGSHYHFAETNQALAFDRAAARGFRLNIAAGNRRTLRAWAEAHGRAGGVRGSARGLRVRRGGDGTPRPRREAGPKEEPSMKIGRRAYAEMYGPTVGDRVRLADTDLIVEVERDLTVYGEEVKFGGGKVIRDGMGQCQRGPSIAQTW